MNVEAKLSATSFESLKQNGSLRWEVQGANWQYMRAVLDIEEAMREADQELHDLLLDIGQTVVDGDTPDPMDIAKAKELQEKLQADELRCVQTKEQMRGAMREKLESMLPSGAVNRISEEHLEAFFAELEKATHVQMGVGRMLDRGMKEARRVLGEEDKPE
jgi:hypothetical protein